jgi:hypothetical protein
MTIQLKEGYWACDSNTTAIFILKNDRFLYKPKIALDYPDIEAIIDMKIQVAKTYNEFGIAHPDISKETGKKNYNMEMSMIVAKIKGVANDTGTEFHILGKNKSLVLVMQWLDWTSMSVLKCAFSLCSNQFATYVKEILSRSTKTSKIIMD